MLRSDRIGYCTVLVPPMTIEFEKKRAWGGWEPQTSKDLLPSLRNMNSNPIINLSIFEVDGVSSQSSSSLLWLQNSWSVRSLFSSVHVLTIRVSFQERKTKYSSIKRDVCARSNSHPHYSFYLRAKIPLSWKKKKWSIHQIIKYLHSLIWNEKNLR